ncbi:hypothetical protein [Acinetobacter phage vB_AbaS_TCUP2199]|nr:hypothetical protein [Acinetobacter phage vB_AbaS_TCUP2199]
MNLVNLRSGDYITLACGLGFVVTSTRVKGDTVAIEMVRKDLKNGGQVHKTMTVTTDGYFSPTKEPTGFDVVRVSTTDRDITFTEAGNYGKSAGVDLHKLYMANDPNIFQYKVRTRNNYWSNVIDVMCEGDIYTLKVDQINGGADSIKYTQYRRNGTTVRAHESDGTFYDAFEIIEVQGL